MKLPHTRWATLLSSGVSSFLDGGAVHVSEAEGKKQHTLADLSPLPPIRVLRPNDNLEIAFDTRTRNPVYALEKVCVSDDPRSAQRRHNFYEEKTLPVAHRSRNSCYHHSGFDRGHMAPAADFTVGRGDTYNLCNISPQNHAVNQQIWARLEAWVRRVARYHENVYVLTGPLWIPRHQRSEQSFEYQFSGIGVPPNLVAVPTHFFKIVVVVSGDVVSHCACFCIPNEEKAASRCFEDYLVRWSDLEAVSGMTFFPLLVSDELKLQIDSLTVIRNHEPRLLLQGDTTRKHAGQSATVEHLCPNGLCPK